MHKENDPVDLVLGDMSMEPGSVDLVTCQERLAL